MIYLTAYLLCIYDHITYIQVDLNFWGSNKRTEWLPWQHVNINTWHFFGRVPVLHAGHLWVTPSKSWCIRTYTCPKNKLTRRKFRKKYQVLQSVFTCRLFFFLQKPWEDDVLSIDSLFLPLWFILILIPFTFPFFSVTHNLRKKKKVPKGSRRFQYKWYE